MEDDNSDVSDLELEVTTYTEGSRVPGSNILTRKRNNSDPGRSQRQETTKENDRRNCSLLQEKLPSFEELTRSMQDLAEKDFDEFCGIKEEKFLLRKNRGTSSEDLRSTRAQTYHAKQISSNGHLVVDKNKKTSESKKNQLEYKENETNKNSNKEDQIDTSASFKNIQQEIENLLAPFTPMPDYQSENKELLVLMKNIGDKPAVNKKLNDNQHMMDGSFEIVENNATDSLEEESIERWILPRHKEYGNYLTKERKIKFDLERKRSENAAQENIKNEDENNGNICYERGAKGTCESFNQSLIFDKDIKNFENCAKASKTFVQENQMKTTIDETMRYFEDQGRKTSTVVNFEEGQKITEKRFHLFS